MIDSDEFLIPLADIRGPLAGLVLGLGISGGKTLAPVLLAVLKNLEKTSEVVVRSRGPYNLLSSERTKRHWAEEWASRFRQRLKEKKLVRRDRRGWRLCLRTLEHVFDKHTALCDFLIDLERLVVGRDEENHGD